MTRIFGGVEELTRDEAEAITEELREAIQQFAVVDGKLRALGGHPDGRPRRRSPSNVYVIGEATSGLVKIGAANDSRDRLQGLQTGNPRELRLLHEEPGVGPLERTLHERFAGRHLRGEWFDFTDSSPVAAVLAAIEDLRS